MTSLTRRIERLEGPADYHETVFVCLNHPGETTEEAVARYRSEHRDTPQRARFVVVQTGIYRTPGSNL